MMIKFKIPVNIMVAPLLTFSLLWTFTIFSCATKDQEQKPGHLVTPAQAPFNADTTKPGIAKETTPINSDTLTIEMKAAVFYQPDSLQIKKRMKQVGESDFRAGADDYIFYLNSAAAYIEKQDLPVLDAQNKKYLKFVLANKQVNVVKLDTLEELWGMYLFDPRKNPYPADITVIEEEFKNYYN